MYSARTLETHPISKIYSDTTRKFESWKEIYMTDVMTLYTFYIRVDRT